MLKRAIIFANGSIAEPQLVRHLLAPDDTLLAADGGTRHALALGLIPSVIIGDLDSLTEDVRRKTKLTGVHFVKHPRDKSETDLELALDYALEQGFGEIVIVGAAGGRLDQTLGNLALLTANRFSKFNIRLDNGVEEAFFTRGSCRIRGEAGEVVSLLPWAGPVTGIVTEGLRWPLRGETLLPEKTRGISNELLGEAAGVSLESGLLLVIHRRQCQP
jgi:thiamine pyrophosphokinase